MSPSAFHHPELIDVIFFLKVAKNIEFSTSKAKKIKKKDAIQ